MKVSNECFVAAGVIYLTDQFSKTNYAHLQN